MSVYGLWRLWENETRDEVDTFIKRFTKEHFKEIAIWGEAVVPQVLALFWYRKRVDAPIHADALLRFLIELISTRNQAGSNIALPSPYYEARDLLPHFIDHQLSSFLPQDLRVSEEPLDASFAGSSFTLEGLMLLFARRGWKQTMRVLWPQITRVTFNDFQVDQPWQYLIWRSKHGAETSVLPNETQSWSELRQKASEPGGNTLPVRLKRYPLFMLLFLLVYPHRVTRDALMWLDSALSRF